MGRGRDKLLTNAFQKTCYAVFCQHFLFIAIYFLNIREDFSACSFINISSREFSLFPWNLVYPNHIVGRVPYKAYLKILKLLVINQPILCQYILQNVGKKLKKMGTLTQIGWE